MPCGMIWARREFLIAAGGALTGATQALAQTGTNAPSASGPEFRSAKDWRPSAGA
jgi:hypothetical protein